MSHQIRFSFNESLQFEFMWKQIIIQSQKLSQSKQLKNNICRLLYLDRGLFSISTARQYNSVLSIKYILSSQYLVLLEANFLIEFPREMSKRFLIWAHVQLVSFVFLFRAACYERHEALKGEKKKNIKAYYLILSEHRRRKNFQDDKLSIEMWQRRIPARVAFDFLYNFKWAVDMNWYEEVNRWYWFQWNSIIEIDRKEESFWHLFNNFRSNDPFQLKASGWK